MSRPRVRANGEGSIYETKGGRFMAQAYVGWTETGTAQKKRRTFDTRAEARVWLAEVRTALADGLEAPDDRLTVGQWMDKWLAGLPGKVSDGTLIAYRNRTRLYVRPYVGGVPLRRLTPSRVSRWLADLSAAGLSPSTAQAAYSTLRRAVTLAQQDGHVGRNVVAIADGPRGSKRTPRWTTPAEVSALLAAGALPRSGGPGRPPKAERLTVAVAILAGTGLRRGELLGLQWSDIDLTADMPTLTVRRQLVRRPGQGLVLAETKTARERTVPLPGFVAAALKEHRKAQAAERLAAGPMWQDHDLIIATEAGGPVDPRNLGTALERLSKRAGVKHVNPHALRHGAVSMLLAEGVPLEIASAVAGHSSIRVTSDIYGHLLTEHLGVAAAAMDRALRPAATS